MNKDKAQLV